MAAVEPEHGRGDDRRQATEAEARALGSALRLRILRLCLGEALTNKEIADRLGRDPASVLHHVRRLVDTGFLQALPVRRGTRGAREVPYQTTGKSWTLSVGDGSGRETGAMLRAFLDELDEAGGELVDSTRLGLRLRAKDREEFSRRINEVFNEFAARPPDPDGEWWSVFYAMHPDRRGRHR
ncbi:MAG: winged helix-turn-helix domain-containing protein [Microlunatus sp.]|nr:winged helix-turn-helix domain-containing protein [Microlunatus sp.]